VAAESVLDLSESGELLVSVTGFDAFSIAPPAFGVESQLWSAYERPHGVNRHDFVDELLAGSLRPRITKREVAAFPDHVRSRLRLALVDALHDRPRWRSLYGSFLSQDDRLFALMLWRSERLSREVAQVHVCFRRRVAEAAHVKVRSRAGLAGRALHSMVPRAPVLTNSSVLDRRASALGLALGRKGGLARSPFEQLGFAKGFASGLFGHRQDELMRPLGVGRFMDDAVGVRGLAAGATPLMGADTTKLIGRNTKPLGIFGVKSTPTSRSKLASGEAGLVASRFARAFGEPPKIAKSIVSALGFTGSRAALHPEALGRVAGRDVGGFGVFEFGRHNAGSLEDAGLLDPGLKASAAPWFSKMFRSSMTGRSDGSLIVTGDFGRVFPDLGKLGVGYLDALRRREEQDAQLAAFERRWEQDALWYLLDHLEVRLLMHLAPLEPEEVETVLLDALEGAVRAEEFSGALQDGIGHARMLNPSQRRHLQHALEHAQAGDWVDASPPLMSGLEGAFWATARERLVINPDRTRADNPNKLIKGVENVVRLVVTDDGFSLFVRRRVFGTTGDSYRHGDADGGERRQVLLGIAALCGWVDEFVGLPALPVLSGELNQEMPAAIGRAEKRRMAPGE
jgi:hypothetical protein